VSVKNPSPEFAIVLYDRKLCYLSSRKYIGDYHHYTRKSVGTAADYVPANPVMLSASIYAKGMPIMIMKKNPLIF
jgi:hypothetical protein